MSTTTYLTPSKYWTVDSDENPSTIYSDQSRDYQG